MRTFFFGGFGLSIFWLLPLIWRVIRPLLAGRKPALSGEGTIRFWLGGLFALLASTTLEGLVVNHYTDDPSVGGSVGRALASGISGVLGIPITSLLMLTVLGVTLPWYLGIPWGSAFVRIASMVDALAEWMNVGVEHLMARFSSQHGRGAVRRVDRRTTAKRSAPMPAQRTPATTAASVPVSQATLPKQTTPLSGMSRTRGAPVREKVISEPWLLPKSARQSPPLPSAPVSSMASSAPVVAKPIAAITNPAAIASSSLMTEERVVEESAAPAHAVLATEPVRAAPIWDAQHEEPEFDDDEMPVEIRPIESGPAESNDWQDVETELVPASQVVRTMPATPIHRYAVNDDHLATPVVPVVAPATAVMRERSTVVLPPLSLLAAASPESTSLGETQLAETSELIEQRLREFKVPVTVVGASAGPVITRFEVEPAVGVRGNQIVALMKDLARGLGRTSIRVVETIPGKTCMGLELPNEQRQMIALSEILDSTEYRDSESLLTLAMGKGITGEPVVADLARAPHMLVAGTTGSGKSVAVNAMILSMLYKATPDDVRMIMIDPKMLELSVYEGIPHLLAPVVTDMKLAANALAWCVAEMENRYRVMSDLRVRNLAGYNQKIREAKAIGRPLMNPFPAHPEVPETLDTLPMIVVVIDELADLMMVAGKKIEELIARLAQKARAAGIHLILATQRPSVDVITGLIKANIPTRVAFQVSSKIDSRTILDQMGAESLLGQGDMLFLPPGTGYPQRIHGAFVADEEVHRVVAHLKQYGEPDYKNEILAGPPTEGSGELFTEDGVDPELDPLYDEAVVFVLRTRRASISFVQRQFRIGYNRAARLVEAMEAAGLVSSMGINGQRDVLAPGPAD